MPKNASRLAPRHDALAHRPVSRRRRHADVAISPLISLLAASLAHAQPEGQSVAQGSASFDQSGAVTTITASHNAIINYHAFNIPAGQTVRFVQPGPEARVLNRVTGGDPSRIDGTLTANGRVYITNPAGIYFGAGSLVNVGSIHAAAGSISDQDFLAGVDRFTDLRGEVINRGHVRAADEVHFLGRHVANMGEIEAEGGVVTMLAGNEALIGRRGDHIYARVSTDQLADAQRSIASGDLYSVAIHDTARIRAAHVRAHGQRVAVHGQVDASALAPGAVGGTVAITGDTVVLDGARINASGPAGGGSIAIGGGFQGRDPDLHNATTTLVSSDSSIHADATAVGPGGTVIVWSDQRTVFGGEISIRGGEQGGDGGFAEVSGKTDLLYRGTTDATAKHGQVGTLLLDPTNIRIVRLGPDAIDLTDVDQFADPDSDTDGDLVFNEISRDLIEAATSDVVLQATNNIELGDPSSVSGSVNITMDNPGVGLTLQAGNSILLNGRIQTRGGAVTLSANDPSSGAPTGTGQIQILNLIDTSLDGLSAPINVTLNGGAAEVLLSGSLVTLNADLTIDGNVRLRTEEAEVALRTDAGAGDILVNGRIVADVPFPGQIRFFSGTGDTTIGDGVEALVDMATTVMSVDGSLRLLGNVESLLLDTSSVDGPVIVEAPSVTITTAGALNLSNATGITALTGAEALTINAALGMDLAPVGAGGAANEPALFRMISPATSTVRGDLTALNLDLSGQTGPLRIAGDTIFTDRDAAVDISGPTTIGGNGALTINAVGDVTLGRIGRGELGTVRAITVDAPGNIRLRGDLFTDGGDIDLSMAPEVIVDPVSATPILTLDTDRAGGAIAAGDVLFNAGGVVYAEPAAVNPITFAINLQADGGAVSGVLHEPIGFFRGFADTQLRVGTLTLNDDAPVDGSLLISGRLLVGADVTIDSNPAPRGSADPRGLGPGARLDLGSASTSSTGGLFALTLDASSTDDAAGPVFLGGVFRGLEQYLAGLAISTASPVSTGAITIQDTSIDGPLTFRGGPLNLTRTLTINTNSDSLGPASSLFLGNRTISPTLPGLTLTLRAEGAAGEPGGAITIGELDEVPERLASIDLSARGGAGAPHGLVRVLATRLATSGLLRVVGDVALDTDLTLETLGGMIDLDEARFAGAAAETNLSLLIAGSSAGAGEVALGAADNFAGHFLQSIGIDTAAATDGSVTLSGDILLDGSASAFALVGNNPLRVRGSRRIDTHQGGFAFAGEVNLGFSPLTADPIDPGSFTIDTSATGATSAGNVFIGSDIADLGGAGDFLTALTIDTTHDTPINPGGTTTLRGDVFIDGPITLRGKVNLAEPVLLDSEQGGDSHAGLIDLSEVSIGGAALILDSRAESGFDSADVLIGDYGTLFAMSQDALTLRTRGGARDGDVVLTSPNGRTIIRVGAITTTDAGGTLRALGDAEVVSDSGADLDLSVFSALETNAAHDLVLAADGAPRGELSLPPIGVSGVRPGSLTARGVRVGATGNILTAGDLDILGELTIPSTGTLRTLDAATGTITLDPSGAPASATIGSGNTLTLRAAEIDWLGTILAGPATTRPTLVLRPNTDAGAITLGAAPSAALDLTAPELALIGSGLAVVVGAQGTGAHNITSGTFQIASDLRLVTRAPGAITLNGAITTLGTPLTIDGPARLAGDATVVTTGGGSSGALVHVLSTLAGDHRLTVNSGTAGDALFDGAITPLTTTGIAFDLAARNVTFAQGIDAASITQIGGAGVTRFNGSARFRGSSGGPAPARGFGLFLDTGSVILAQTITSDGTNQAFESPLVLLPFATMSPRLRADGGAGAGSIVLADTVNSGPGQIADFGVLAGPTGRIEVLAPVGGVDPVGVLSLTAGHADVLADLTANAITIVADTGRLDTVARSINAINLTGAFELIADSGLRATRDDGGDIIITGPVDGSGFVFTLDAGPDGDILAGPIGQSQRLDAIELLNARNATFAGPVFTGTFTQLAGASRTTFEAGLDTTGTFTFTGNELFLGIDDTTSPAPIVLGGDAAVDNAGLFRITDTSLTLGGALTQTGAGPSSVGTDLDSPSLIAFDSAVAITRPIIINAPRAVFGDTLASGSHDLDICSADLLFGAPATVVGTGTLTLRPCQPTDPIFLGVDGATPPANALDLSVADLAAIADGYAAIVIGWADIGSHQITVGHADFRDPLTIHAPVAPGRMTVLGALRGTTNASITYLGSGDGLTLTGEITTDGQDILISDALHSTSPAASIASSGGSIVVTGPIDGPGALALDAAAGAIDLRGVVGGFTPLASLDALAATINSLAITTGGDLVLTGALTPDGDLTSVAGSITVDGATTLVRDLLVTSGGSNTTATFTGSIAGPHALTIDNAGGVIDLASVTTSDGQLYIGDATLRGDLADDAGPIELLGDITLAADLTIATPDAIFVDGSTNGMFALVLKASDIEFTGSIGDGSELTSLTATAEFVRFAGASTKGDQRYTGDAFFTGDYRTTQGGSFLLDGPLTINGDEVSFITTGEGEGHFTIAGPIDGAASLTLDLFGDALFGDAVGATTPLTSLTLAATSAEMRAVTTTGNQTYDAVVAASGDLMAGGTISLDNGSEAVSTFAGDLLAGTDINIGAGAAFEADLEAGSNVTFTAPVTVAGDIDAGADITASDAATFAGDLTAGDSITTNGPTSFAGDLSAGGAITIAGWATLADSIDIAADALLFSSTLDGPHSLSITTTGLTDLAGPVGSLDPLASLLIDAGAVVAPSLAATGAIEITAGSIALAALDASGIALTGNTVALSGAVRTTGGGLTIDNVGTLDIAGTATFNELGGDFLQRGEGETRLAASILNNANDIIFSAPIELATDAVTIAGRSIELRSVFNGESPASLIVSASDTATLLGDFGSLASPLAAFDDGTTGLLTLDGRIFSSTGITFDAPVLIAGPSAVRVFGASGLDDSIVFASTIDGFGDQADLALLVNLAAQGAAIPRIEFRDSIGLGSAAGAGALRSLFLNADPLGIAGETGLNGHTFIPEVASIFAPQDITVRVTDELVMGQNEKWSTVGAINLISDTGAITLGDLSALTSIDVTAPSIFILSRAASGIRAGETVNAPTSALAIDDGVDFVAGDSITFSTAPVVLGSGPVPTLATASGGSTSATLSSFPTRAFGPLGQELLQPGFDLRSSGPTNTNVSQALAGAAPREAQSERVSRGTSISQSQKEALLRLGINARDADATTLVEAMNGRALYNDTVADAENASAQVTAQRLPEEIVNLVINWYNTEFQGYATDVGEGQTPEDAIRRALESSIEAWAEAENPEEFDATALRAFIRNHPEHADAARAIDGVAALLTQMEWLGLSAAEQRDARQVLLSFMRPRRLSLTQFAELVSPSDEQADATTAPTSDPIGAAQPVEAREGA